MRKDQAKREDQIKKEGSRKKEGKIQNKEKRGKFWREKLRIQLENKGGATIKGRQAASQQFSPEPESEGEGSF